MSAEKVAFAREWLERGECPGCGSDLTAVAGKGIRHYLPGQPVTRSGDRPPLFTGRNDVIGTLGAIAPDDPRLCSWSPDDLVSLVLIGSGQVLDAGGAHCAESAAAASLAPPASMSSTGPGVPPLPAPGSVVLSGGAKPSGTDPSGDGSTVPGSSFGSLGPTWAQGER